MKPTLVTWALVVFGVITLMPLIWAQFSMLIRSDSQAAGASSSAKGKHGAIRRTFDWLWERLGPTGCSSARYSWPVVLVCFWAKSGATFSSGRQVRAACTSISSCGSRRRNTFIQRGDRSSTSPTIVDSSCIGVHSPWLTRLHAYPASRSDVLQRRLTARRTMRAGSNSAHSTTRKQRQTGCVVPTDSGNRAGVICRQGLLPCDAATVIRLRNG